MKASSNWPLGPVSKGWGEGVVGARVGEVVVGAREGDSDFDFRGPYNPRVLLLIAHLSFIFPIIPRRHFHNSPTPVLTITRVT